MSPTGELTWIVAPALPGVELTRARVASPRAMAFLGQLVLVRCDAGAAEVRWAGHTELLRPGAALAKPADAPPTVLRRAAPTLEYRLVRVDPVRLPTSAAG